MIIKPGTVVTFRRSFEQADFDRFAALSGDDNPIHVDPEFARRTRFGRTVSHGMLLYSTLCRTLTEELGAGFVQLEQELMFVSPTYTGEEVEVRLEITALPPGGLADLSTVITRSEGSIACQGRTLVGLPDATAGVTIDSLMAAKAPVIPVAGVPAADARAGAASHKSLALGQTADVVRTFSEADLEEYRDLSGDDNPAFSDPAYARHLDWPGPLVPGPLLGGLFSFLLGTRLPGRGTNWLKQRLVFPAPCHAGDEVTARVEITRLRPDKDLVNLRGVCLARGRVVCEGESLVLVKDLSQEHA